MKSVAERQQKALQGAEPSIPDYNIMKRQSVRVIKQSIFGELSHAPGVIQSKTPDEPGPGVTTLTIQAASRA